MTKTCTKCGEEKSLGDFYKNVRYKDGRSYWCKECSRESHRLYTQKHADKRRAANLKYKFGITPECYDRMFEEQGGACAICGTTETEARNNYFCVDHDHTTGAVRGLLCGRCNKGIGLLQDSVANLRSAITYLEHHEAVVS